MRSIIAVILILIVTSTKAEVAWLDSTYVNGHSSLSGVSNSKLNPLWLYSNEWGRYTQYDQAEGTLGFDIRTQLLTSKNASIEIGFGADLNSQLDDSYIHNAYLSARLFIFDFEIGMRPYSPVIINDDLTSGAYLMSSNARPQPRIGVGIYDWWSIPYTRDWLQIRGAVYVGRLMDEDNDLFTKDVLLHEKFGYVRFGGWYAKLYAGLIHSVLFGGTMPNGYELPVDFWASFLGKGSSKFDNTPYRGESTNAAGGHMGYWDVGFDIDFPNNAKMKIYLTRMGTDHGILHPQNFKDRKDFILGTVVTTNFEPLKSFCVEYYKTDHQGGTGLPDPAGYDKNGEYIQFYPGDSGSDPRAWALAHIDEEAVLAWEAKEGTIKKDNDVRNFLREYWNCGEHGGRFTYLNNGMYYQGWSYNGLSLGTPLYHSYKTVDIYRNGEGNVQNKMFFTNNRVVAITLSAQGRIQKFDYRLKYTFSMNHGSLQEKYTSNSSFDLLEDYYYEKERNEHYLLLDLHYRINKSLKARCTLASDFGELYHSTGLRLGLVYETNF